MLWLRLGTSLLLQTLNVSTLEDVWALPLKLFKGKVFIAHLVSAPRSSKALIQQQLSEAFPDLSGFHIFAVTEASLWSVCYVSAVTCLVKQESSFLSLGSMEPCFEMESSLQIQTGKQSISRWTISSFGPEQLDNGGTTTCPQLRTLPFPSLLSVGLPSLPQSHIYFWLSRSSPQHLLDSHILGGREAGENKLLSQALLDLFTRRHNHREVGINALIGVCLALFPISTQDTPGSGDSCAQPLASLQDKVCPFPSWSMELQV